MSLGRSAVIAAPEPLQFSADLSIGHTVLRRRSGFPARRGCLRPATGRAGRQRSSEVLVGLDDGRQGILGMAKASLTVSPSVTSSGRRGEVTMNPPSGWGESSNGSL